VKKPQPYVSWSAHSELWLRRCLTLDACMVCCFSTGMIWCMFWHGRFAAVACMGGALLFLILSARDIARLHLMLQNRPANPAARLTHWIQLRAWQTELCCECGAQVHISRATWFPNPYDAGGGRFSLVCQCGVGYFKLRESPTQNTTRGALQ
jgi:hypothetical protein